jgi:hypothetical protein
MKRQFYSEAYAIYWYLMEHNLGFLLGKINSGKNVENKLRNALLGIRLTR